MNDRHDALFDASLWAPSLIVDNNYVSNARAINLLDKSETQA
jgi:hypothetical protein